MLANILEELGMQAQEVLGTSTFGEVPQGEATCEDIPVEALYMLILCMVDASVEVRSIVLVDGVDEDDHKLLIGSGERLQEQSSFSEFFLHPHMVCGGC